MVLLYSWVKKPERKLPRRSYTHDFADIVTTDSDICERETTKVSIMKYSGTPL